MKKAKLKIPYNLKELKDLEGKDFLKEKARIRDHYTCQKCGKVWVPGTRRFDVHHKNFIPSQTVAMKYSKNKDLDRLITLCHRCHMNLPEHKLAIAKAPFMWEYHVPFRMAFRKREQLLKTNH